MKTRESGAPCVACGMGLWASVHGPEGSHTFEAPERPQEEDWQFRALVAELRAEKYEGILRSIVGFADLMTGDYDANALAVMFIAAAKDARSALDR